MQHLRVYHTYCYQIEQVVHIFVVVVVLLKFNIQRKWGGAYFQHFSGKRDRGIKIRSSDRSVEETGLYWRPLKGLEQGFEEPDERHGLEG